MMKRQWCQRLWNQQTQHRIYIWSA